MGQTFRHASIEGHKSLKPYKYFFDGYVKKVWVFSKAQVKLENTIFLCYFYPTDLPYEVFVSLNGDNGDVYAGQCAE